jgi:hypothetical protein
VLSFDAAFDAQPHTQLLKEQLAQVRALLYVSGCRILQSSITHSAAVFVF